MCTALNFSKYGIESLKSWNRVTWLNNVMRLGMILFGLSIVEHGDCPYYLVDYVGAWNCAGYTLVPMRFWCFASIVSDSNGDIVEVTQNMVVFGHGSLSHC
jgi:hypothetical protein